MPEMSPARKTTAVMTLASPQNDKRPSHAELVRCPNACLSSCMSLAARIDTADNTN